MNRRILVFALLIATLWPAVVCARATPVPPGLAGQVWADHEPARDTTVFAYEVASAALLKVMVDRQGRFLFADLPAGLYKVVAHKTGFQPAVEVILRRTPRDAQQVELRLAEETADSFYGEAFWEARRAVPADVLREMSGFGPSGPSTVEIAAGDRLDLVTASSQALQTRLSAAGGVENLGADLGELERRSAGIGLKGAVGDFRMDLRGRFEQLEGHGATPATSFDGAIHTVDLSTSSDRSALTLSTSEGESPSISPSGVSTAELSSHRIGWAGQTGERGHSEISARYVEEANYHRQGRLDPVDLPAASRTWDVGGEYRQSLTPSTSLEAGIRYRERSYFDHAFDGEPDASIDIFGQADSRIRPRVLVEYGLFSTVRDDSLSLVPHGGLVVELGKDWRAHGRFSQRIEDSTQPAIVFDTARFDDPQFCQRSGESCYEVRLSRGEDLETASIGAVHREFAETLRLYFSDDFFDRLQSLFVVRGDQLPEVNFRLVRQISPRILATLQSNIASGGGGIFYATDSKAYENSIRYLVTSIDTRFQSTSTGVFVAFHHLEQDLEPITVDQGGGSAVEMQKLQLMLTQDLSALANVASHFAVRFNMELSRGSTPYTLSVDEELSRKLSGGISVSF